MRRTALSALAIAYGSAVATDHNQTSTSILHTREAIAAGRVSALAVADASLDRADALNPRLNALTEVFHDHARARARQIDAIVASGQSLPPLAGVPVVLKDNICLSWGKTTCASRMLENYRSPFTAAAAQKLIDAGAVIIAKANLDEFAMGSSGEHSFFGPTRNPWDMSRVPGGSSSGSAAAVSAGIVPGALGSDTGGSIRMPAGYCNLVGFKPTYGRVSRSGLVAYASSLDQIGPLTTTVEDAALLASVISGFDAQDSTTSSLPAPDWLTDLHTPLDRAVLGVPAFARSASNHPAVAEALQRAITTFTDLGATIIDVDFPNAPYAIGAYYLIACAEASSNLARFDGVRFGRRASNPTSLDDLYSRSRAEGLGQEVQARIMLGTHILSSGYYDAYYLTALKARRRITQDFDHAFAPTPQQSRPACHALLLPSAPGPAFALGEKTADPLTMYLEDVYTVSVNLAGLPAITLPAGFAHDGGKDLPVGIQLVSPAFEEAALLRLARMFERATNFGTRRPPLT